MKNEISDATINSVHEKMVKKFGVAREAFKNNDKDLYHVLISEYLEISSIYRTLIKFRYNL